MTATTGRRPAECERFDRHEHQLRLGCSRIAHERLGWCGHDPGHATTDEVIGWRRLALDEGPRRESATAVSGLCFTGHHERCGGCPGCRCHTVEGASS